MQPAEYAAVTMGLTDKFFGTRPNPRLLPEHARSARVSGFKLIVVTGVLILAMIASIGVITDLLHDLYLFLQDLSAK
jgi:hypothetical protein